MSGLGVTWGSHCQGRVTGCESKTSACGRQPRGRCSKENPAVECPLFSNSAASEPLHTLHSCGSPWKTTEIGPWGVGWIFQLPCATSHDGGGRGGLSRNPRGNAVFTLYTLWVCRFVRPNGLTMIAHKLTILRQLSQCNITPFLCLLLCVFLKP